jgi:hypothetical protein
MHNRSDVTNVVMQQLHGHVNIVCVIHLCLCTGQSVIASADNIVCTLLASCLKRRMSHMILKLLMTHVAEVTVS